MSEPRSRRTGLVLAWGAPLLWMGGIWAMSSVQVAAPVALFSHADKVAHAAEYALLGALLVNALVRGFRGLRQRLAYALAAAVALATGFGVADEIHQRFVPGREPDVYDVAADFAGASVGALSALRILRLRRDARPRT